MFVVDFSFIDFILHFFRKGKIKFPLLKLQLINFMIKNAIIFKILLL